MQSRDEHLAAIADAIVSYLDSHPDAADTIEGIAKWWLPAKMCGDMRSIHSALARLAAQGVVQRRTHADRHVVYSRKPQ